MSEEMDAWVAGTVLPAFTPTMGLFLAISTGYGLWKVGAGCCRWRAMRGRGWVWQEGSPLTYGLRPSGSAACTKCFGLPASLPGFLLLTAARPCCGMCVPLQTRAAPEEKSN